MKKPLILGLVFALVTVGLSSVFIIDEGRQAVRTRFGKPIGEAVTEPGLNFKMPFVDDVHIFDKRFLEWDGRVTEVQTREKQPILVDTYGRWRIVDPLTFFQRVGNELRAQARLDGILNGEVRDGVASYNLAELIRSTANRVPVQDVMTDTSDQLEPIDDGRELIRTEILTNARERVKQADLGIELLDIQFKRINYVGAVRASVYERMKAERHRIADRFRSEGEAEAARIRGSKEKDLQQITSEAYKTAQEVIGKADAEATQIYADAYNQSSDARAFYAFIKSMETYESTFDGETMLMLSTEGDFYRYLKGAQ